MSRCDECKHFYRREWQITHGTCEWVDSTDAIVPKWVRANWPTIRKDDDDKCAAFSAGTYKPRDECAAAIRALGRRE